MIRRLFQVLLVVSVAFVATPITGSSAPATVYGFEECAEGWTVRESREDPADDTGEWKPSPTGNPEGSPVQAFRTFPYPFAAQAGDPEAVSYEAWLTSPVHSFSSASKITYYVKHNLETVPPDLPVTGGDYVEVLLSTNGGGSFKKVAKIQGLSTGFVKKEVAVPSAGQVVLQFHLYSDNNTSGEGGTGGEVAIDDVVFPTPRPTDATCAGGGGPKCTKTGNSEGNTINGTSGADRLCGKGGKDKLYGKGGKDVLVGGKGRDLCVGGKGQDTFKGCEVKRQ